MIIQINTDKTLIGNKKRQDFFTLQIEEYLKRFASHITRIEVHLKDENGIKDGLNDITCLLEARLEGRQPIAVSCQANSVALSLTGALDKMNNALKTILGRAKNH